MPTAVVLVVEDEVLIRMDAVSMIEERRLQGIEAGNADEAIVFLETRPDISIVFTDIDMPAPWTVSSWRMRSAIAGRRSS